jgi:hypothetical protein
MFLLMGYRPKIPAEKVKKYPGSQRRVLKGPGGAKAELF